MIMVQPKIIKMDKRYFTGMFGSIFPTKEQGKLHKKFNEYYNSKPYEKSDKYNCHIYLWNMPKNKNFFFGYETSSIINDSDFTTIEIPACVWAIFEVSPAKWWVSGDKEVEGWVKKNKEYNWLKYDGSKCQLEYYKEKFVGADNPDSLMEVWYPLNEKSNTAV
ncbi:MAG: GyrI-like domain-containing protein [Lachnospiraceae bacterium]|jgi:predicted transcriptional regulator YdeE|nr:GyrI-like domain-containing protein [Lachnospiraceae bacterium]